MKKPSANRIAGPFQDWRIGTPRPAGLENPAYQFFNNLTESAPAGPVADSGVRHYEEFWGMFSRRGRVCLSWEKDAHSEQDQNREGGQHA